MTLPLNFFINFRGIRPQTLVGGSQVFLSWENAFESRDRATNVYVIFWLLRVKITLNEWLVINIINILTIHLTGLSPEILQTKREISLNLRYISILLKIILLSAD